MQVPSFDNKVAMTMIQQELGRPWQEVYSELTPRPIAAASLGQVSTHIPSFDCGLIPRRWPFPRDQCFT